MPTCKFDAFDHSKLKFYLLLKEKKKRNSLLFLLLQLWFRLHCFTDNTACLAQYVDLVFRLFQKTLIFLFFLFFVSSFLLPSPYLPSFPHFFSPFILPSFCLLLRIKPRILRLVGRLSTNELQPQAVIAFCTYIVFLL